LCGSPRFLDGRSNTERPGRLQEEIREEGIGRATPQETSDLPKLRRCLTRVLTNEPALDMRGVLHLWNRDSYACNSS